MIRYANCKVYTIDKSSNVAESFVVENGLFAGVGTLQEMRDRFPSAEEVDLGGAAVLPGLIDGHAHPLMATEQAAINKTVYPSKFEDLMNWIRENGRRTDKDKWSYIHRIFPSRIDNFRYPTRKEMDEASPDVPVFLNGAFGGVLNSKALELCDITDETNHPGIIKDNEGKITGALLRSAHNLTPYKIGANRSFDESGYREMLLRYAALGITGVTEVFLSTMTIDKVKVMAANGKLPIRISCNFCPGIPKTLEEAEVLIKDLNLKTGDGDDWFRIGPFKTYVDGGMLTATAYMSEPYGEPANKMFGGGKPDYRGVTAYTDPAVLAAIIDVSRKKGWSYTAHCTGDGAVATLLNAYHILHKKKPLNSERFQFLHGNFMSARSINMITEMGILWDFQAAWLYRDAEALDFWLGAKRMKEFLPLKSAIRKGAIICAGSDHMDGLDPDSSVNPYNPWLGMYAMCSRKSDKGRVFSAGEALTREEAIRAYTINNAYKSGEEKIKGSIEEGKLADFIALKSDPFTCDIEELPSVRPFLRSVGGTEMSIKD
ncbi:MAG: amidohydrolase [Fibrobacteres bacterium]|nr:amidohydrolase [Fibrobacterota bacterium]